MDTKKILNFSYEEVMNRINRAKESEKDRVTKRLKDLSDEERQIENVFKNHKLGVWSKGLQKGVTQYVQESYDEERNIIEKQMQLEREIGESSFITEMNKDIYTFDLEQNNANEQEIENEVNDLSNYVGEEDDYGELDGDEYY